ncbi:MAG: hypothetical protein NVSMB24_10080 [Mucilaginibacter sp.]
MKTFYKKFLYAASGTALCLFLALSASAQRGATGGGGGVRSSGGGGGGSSSSGGGGGGVTYTPPPSSSSRPASGSSGYTPSNGGVSTPNYNRSSSGNVGISRPGFGVAPQRTTTQQQGYINRQGVVARGNYGYATRQGVSPRNSFGFAPRRGVNANTLAGGLAVTPRGATSGGINYRTAPQIGYGGYWGNHGYYHYYHGYYNTYYYPQLGFTCGYLPYGYYPFYFGDEEFFYSGGLFYQYNNSVYTVVEPPIGAELATLPEKAQSIVINGQQYYELNGVYYQPYTKDDGTIVYQVVGKDGELNTNSSVQDVRPRAPQMGDIVLELPLDCRKIKVNGQRLWVSPEGIYYQELVDANNNKSYKIVGLPADEQEQN